MKKSILVLVLTVSLAAGSAWPQNRGVGLGVVVGEPFGITAKLWLDRRAAVDLALGFGDENFHADYIVHNFRLFNVRRGRLPLFYGVGFAARFSKDSLGVRVPVGLSYLFPSDPLDIFFEIVPLVYVVNNPEFVVAGALGIRYYFR
jgi:hypothetical protein